MDQHPVTNYIKEARLSGISLSDPEVLKSLSAVKEDGAFAAIDQALTKSGELKAQGRNRFFKHSEMDKLLSRLFGVPLETLIAWTRPGRFFSGIELADAGLAKLVDLFAGDLRQQVGNA